MLVTFQTADAVAVELNNATAETFSQEFNAKRKTIPTHTLKELVNLKVIVVPNSVKIEKANRSQDYYTVTVDIGIQKKVGPDIETEVAQLSTLTSELVEYLTRKQLAMMPGLKWHKTENTPIYDLETLEQMQVYLSVVTVSYKGLST